MAGAGLLGGCGQGGKIRIGADQSGKPRRHKRMRCFLLRRPQPCADAIMAATMFCRQPLPMLMSECSNIGSVVAADSTMDQYGAGPRGA